MEEMQQSTADVELHSETNESEELSNKELLNNLIGLDEPTTDNNQTGEEEQEDYEESEEVSEENADTGENENNFYTAKELFSLIKNNQAIDQSKMSDELKELYSDLVDYKKSLQGDYTKKTQKVAEDKKTFEEQLKAFETEKREREQAEKIADETKLTAQEVISIRNWLKDEFRKSYNVDYDESIPEHKEIFDEALTKETKRFQTEKENRNKPVKLRQALLDTFGDNFQELDIKAKEEFEKLPYKQAVILEKAIKEGNIDVALSFYHQVANKNNQPQQVQVQTQKQEQKVFKQPPSSFSKNSVLPKKTEKADWKNFI